MEKPLETIDGENGLVAKIYQDLEPDNPRECCDNFGTMVCFHRNYVLGDRHDLKAADFSGSGEVEKYLREKEGAAVILPLYLLDHSGLRISTGPFSCDPGGWDSGIVGFIYATREAILKEYGAKRLSEKLLEKARSVLMSEVEVYDQYLAGDVYRYVIEDAGGEHIDSCWGLYGSDYAEKCAREALDFALASAAINTEKGE